MADMSDRIAEQTPCSRDNLGDRPSFLTTAKAWQRASAARRRVFEDGDNLFADPAWEILLDLYIQEVEHRLVMVSAAAAASCVPPTTALRWINRLEDAKLVRKLPDHLDRRITYLHLTDDGRARIERAFAAAAQGDRKLGLGRLTVIEKVAPVLNMR